MVRLIYHCGFLKTGTTAVQTVLAGARAALEREGYFYPQLEGGAVPGHWALSALWHDGLPKGHPMGRRLMALGGGAAAEAQVIAALEASVAAARAVGGVVILSDEILSLGPARLGRRRLDALFDRLGVDPVLLAYARRDPELLPSRIQQRLKSYRALPRLWDASHADALAHLRDDFPTRPLTLRLFDPSALEGGDIWQDFRQSVMRLGGRPMADHGPAPRVNEAMSAPASALLTMINGLAIERDGPIGADPTAPGFAYLRQKLLSGGAPPGPKLVLPEDLAQRLNLTRAGPWNALLEVAEAAPEVRARLRLSLPAAPGLAPLTRPDLIAWVLSHWDRDWLCGLAASLKGDPRPPARQAEALIAPLLGPEFPRMPLALDDNLD